MSTDFDRDADLDLDDLDAEESVPPGEKSLSIEEEETSGGTWLQGVWICAATFIPTFLAVLLGVPYLLGWSAAIHSPARPESPPQVTLSPAPDPSIAPPTQDMLPEPAQTPPVDTSALLPRPGQSEDSPPPHQDGKPEPPATTSGRGESAVEPGDPTASRQETAEIKPRASTRTRAKDGFWTPAAAFEDPAAAKRLAESIVRQGYPAEVRRDESATRPWTVWVGKYPNKSERP